MSTTGEAAGIEGSGQPASSSSAPVSAVDDSWRFCFECDDPAPPAELYCPSCKVGHCNRCDNYVHTVSKANRRHVRMKLDEYLNVRHGLGGSSPIGAQIKADYKNKFCIVSPVDGRILLRPLLASLVADPDARPSLVAFIGPTGVGKSTLLRMLISMDGEKEDCMPVAGKADDPQSTSSDIHMYKGGQVRTQLGAQFTVDSTYPLLYVDSEGCGGSKEPRAIHRTWEFFRDFYQDRLGKYEDFQNRRYVHVQVSYPRILYNFSDVLCFVYSGDWRERESIVPPLLTWSQSGAKGAANHLLPQLVLIFNKTGEEAEKSKFDDFRETYRTWIQGDKRRVELEQFYSDPLVFLIPHAEVNMSMVYKRVEMLCHEIREASKRIRKSREQVNQLFTRRQLQLYMQLAADTFSKNEDAEFDIYTASMARRPISGQLGGYIVEFRRLVEEALGQETGKFKRHEMSLRVLTKRIGWSVLLWIGRHDGNILAIGEKAKLPLKLLTDLHEAQSEIDGAMPCAGRQGGDGFDCDKLRSMHEDGEPHVTAQTFATIRFSPRWPGDFEPNEEVQLASDACRLVKLVEHAQQNTKTLDVKVIRGNLSSLRKGEQKNYPLLDFSDFYQVCASCITELPTEMLSCGHIICGMCATEAAPTRSPAEKIISLECPICFSFVKWYPKDLPSLAGYRVLSLDGGGVRGIVELLTLEKIMSFFPSMHVEDLFDIIVGTSTGGIIALALTVAPFCDQPKRLPEVIQLFQHFCKEVFSDQMLRFGASKGWFLRLCQFVRWYDTKYKNDNLLKLLKEQFGVQPMMRSCVHGPHVIVTACDRDNNLTAAWFTSYNRQVPTRENENDKLIEEECRQETKQPTRNCRVLNNHLFSVMDVAAATSAAGTYFPAYKADNYYWVDGGLQFNGPAEVALLEARAMWPKRRASALISLGCGELIHDEKHKPSDSAKYILEEIVRIATDADKQCRSAIEQLQVLQQDPSPCGIRVNPIIRVPKGKSCKLDDAKEVEFLICETKAYLGKNGLADVQKAANLLFAALFYLNVEIDQETLQPNFNKLSIRSRAALPESLRGALIEASKSSSPPFSVTVSNASGAEPNFFWLQCTWEQGIMNLPFMLSKLPPLVGPLEVWVKLHLCLPESTAPEGPRPISGMPYEYDATKF